MGTSYEVGSGGTYDHYATLEEAVDIINSSSFLFDSSIDDIYFELVSNTTETSQITITYNNSDANIYFRPQPGQTSLVKVIPAWRQQKQ